MSEFNIGTLAIIALAICVIDCFFWMWGGRHGNWKRRFIGSAIQSLGINILAIICGTWVWQFAASVIPEMASRCLGYGDKPPGKLIRRSVFALGSLAVGVILAWGLSFSPKAITVLICQAVASIVSIILGMKNPFPAAVEEPFVCLFLKALNYGYVFIALI